MVRPTVRGFRDTFGDPSGEHQAGLGRKGRTYSGLIAALQLPLQPALREILGGGLGTVPGSQYLRYPAFGR
jgi:hypothetical protein